MKKIFYLNLFACIILLSAGYPLPLSAQKKTKNTSTYGFDTLLYNGLQWRSIGPYRGGRSCAVVGVSSSKATFYFGSTGGGVWKTVNNGASRKNVSDGYFGGSIGLLL